LLRIGVVRQLFVRENRVREVLEFLQVDRAVELPARGRGLGPSARARRRDRPANAAGNRSRRAALCPRAFRLRGGPSNPGSLAQRSKNTFERRRRGALVRDAESSFLGLQPVAGGPLADLLRPLDHVPRTASSRLARHASAFSSSAFGNVTLEAFARAVEGARSLV
jgi:hypothetical protein